MAFKTQAWWMVLCAVSSLNVAGWLASVAIARRRQASLQPAIGTAMRLQMVLSAGYVVGCAYRSAFPVFDVRRLCMVDSWLSSVIVGRSVATFAELCFAAQWALLLKGVAQATGSTTGVRVSRVIVPMIAVAEICSWYAVLTTSNLGHVLEESIWGFAAAALVASLVFLLPRCRPEVRPMLAAGCVLGLAYVVYMFDVDVPRYWARWVFDVGHGHPYLSIDQGLVDASSRWIVSHRWVDWETEVVWMTLYFSVAVWLSISLIHLPRLFGLQGSPTLSGADGGRRSDRSTFRTKTVHF